MEINTPQTPAPPFKIQSQAGSEYLDIRPLQDQVLYDLRAHRAGWYDQAKLSEVENATDESRTLAKALRKAESDFALGYTLFVRHTSASRNLSPRQRTASEVLKHIGLYEIEYMAQQADLGPDYVDYTPDSLSEIRVNLLKAVKSYLLHLEPCEARPIEAMLGDSSVMQASGGVEPAKTRPMDNEWEMKKAALIAKHAPQWTTIKSDFHNASENGLSKAAKGAKHGEWREAAALDWARQRGKLKEEKQQGPANSIFYLSGKMHTIKH